MRFDGKTTKRRITKWGLNELSSVKSGAQAPAKATILKTGGVDVEQALVDAGFTSEEANTVQAVVDHAGDIPEQVATLAKRFGKSTSQPVSDDVNIRPNEKPNGDTDMSDPKTPEQLEAKVAKLEAANADLAVLAKMSDDEKAYMSKMSEEDKAKFKGMSAEERKKAMGVAKAADESFTDSMGQTIAKSEVGDAAFAIMKNQNEQLLKMQADTEQREALELVKSLCPNLPGEESQMASAIQKCKKSLSVEDFAVLEKALKAGDNAMASRTEKRAHDKPVGNGGARATFEDGIAKIMSEKSISELEAMQSPEGLALAKTLRKAEAEEAE